MSDRQRQLLLKRCEVFQAQLELCAEQLEPTWDEDKDPEDDEIEDYLDSSASAVSSIWSLSKSLHNDLRRGARHHD